MKNDVVMYEKVYDILKNKIQCGILPGGSKLPSRANLCIEFNTSEKTVRRALKMLEQDGLLETVQRKRPVVAMNHDLGRQAGLMSLKRADSAVSVDMLKSGILLCYPINGKGMALCSGNDWDIPQAIADRMDPDNPTEFWRLSNRFWRFFISRNGNELILRAVDSLGFSNLDLLPGTRELRCRYKDGLNELIKTIRCGGSPERVHFEDLSVLYGLTPEGAQEVQGDGVGSAPSVTPRCSDADSVKQKLRRGQERYSSVYLDILGLIALGRYRPGDRLPSHEEMQGIYHVSIDTTIKAVQVLQELGAVTAKRGQGIFVAMDLDRLKEIRIAPEMIASHVRRWLDCLELISLTVEGVAAHGAAHASEEEAVLLRGEIERLWNDTYLYQMSPYIILDFIVDHIEYNVLRAIYDIMRQNYHIGRSIPNLIRLEKTPVNRDVYRQCLDAVDSLIEGSATAFAKKAADMFQMTHRIIVEECKRLGYWEAAMKVYDGDTLWK